MSDAPAYMLANLVINDVDEYRKYEKGFFSYTQALWWRVPHL